MGRYRYIIILILGTTLIVSCAREVSPDPSLSERKIVKAFIDINYPGVMPMKSGVYILSRDKGAGAALSYESTVFMDYSVKGLSGNYIYTTNKDLAQRYGLYSRTHHYEPGIITVKSGEIIVGLEEILLSSSVGTKATILIPSWLSGYSKESEAKSFTEPMIYEIDIKNSVANYEQHEMEQLKRFSEKYCNGVDSLEKGFYKYIKSAGKDTVAYGKSIAVRYLGKLMDGFVFDTNIIDTAKQYRIYSDDETKYAPLKFSKKDKTTVTHEGGVTNAYSKTYPPGLLKGIASMKYGEKAFIFFSSKWGFGQTNSKNFQTNQPTIYYVEALSAEETD